MVPDERLASTARRVSRTTAWELVGELRLGFDAGHPQGMVRVDDTWWISTVDLRTASGWVVAVDGAGDLIHQTPIGDRRRFHPGGMDHDGEALWVASSEYRPRSSALVERLVPDGHSTPEPTFEVDDHVGAIVRLGASGDLVGWTWGSRRFLRWRPDGVVIAEARNPGHFVDLQDGQWIGDDLVLATGVGAVPAAQGSVPLGGLAVVSSADLSVVVEAPFPGYSRTSGRPATYNPMFAEVLGTSMLVHLLPDDGRGVILTYATPLVP